MNASFPKWLSIANKDNSVLVGLFLAIEFTAFSSWIFKPSLIVFKRCSGLMRQVQPNRISPASVTDNFPQCHCYPIDGLADPTSN